MMITKLLSFICGVLVFTVVFLAIERYFDKKAITTQKEQINTLTGEKMGFVATIEGYEYAKKLSEKRIKQLQEDIKNSSDNKRWASDIVPAGVVRRLCADGNKACKDKAD